MADDMKNSRNPPEDTTPAAVPAQEERETAETKKVTTRCNRMECDTEEEERVAEDEKVEEEDCPLCLLPLEPHDRSHPLQCTSRHCDFNCCTDCLERMIKSTCERVEASDGNTFAVLLHCPNCRSNLGPSTRDTVLLRKVDKYSREAHLSGTADEELSASELRFKYALEKDGDIMAAIGAARQREDDFFGRALGDADGIPFDQYLGGNDAGGSLSDSLGRSGRSSNRGSMWSFDEEEGFEVDWATGPRNSFIFRHHSMFDLSAAEDEPEESQDAEADPTLLSGLEAFMTDQEQQFITAHLISGDTSRLAAATEMMHYVSALSRQGMRPGLRRQRSSRAGRSKSKRGMLESIREVIREGNEARRLEAERGAREAVGAAALRWDGAARRAPGGATGGRRNLTRLVEMEARRQMEYMRLHPLPLRMPKYAEITVSKSQLVKLSFLDDVWDGTVLDAFSKISVSKGLLGHVKVTKQDADAKSVGIRAVIDADPVRSPRSNSKGYIDTVRPRVIVASISRELGQHGVVKGDVVTHFNGEGFAGTAAELSDLVNSRYEGEVLTFVFNADSAVAEALKRRSMISGL